MQLAIAALGLLLMDGRDGGRTLVFLECEMLKLAHIFYPNIISGFDLWPIVVVDLLELSYDMEHKMHLILMYIHMDLIVQLCLILCT